MRTPAAPTRSLGSRSRTWIRSRRRSRRSRRLEKGSRPRGLRSRSNASSVGDSVPDARSPDPVASWERAPEARRVRGGLCSEVMSGPSLRGIGAALDPAATVLRVSAHHMPFAGRCSETFPECWPGHLCLGARTPEPLGLRSSASIWFGRTAAGSLEMHRVAEGLPLRPPPRDLVELCAVGARERRLPGDQVEVGRVAGLNGGVWAPAWRLSPPST